MRTILRCCGEPFLLFRYKARAPTLVKHFPRWGYGRLYKNLQKKKIHKFQVFFQNFSRYSYKKKTSVGQMIACYKQNIHLLPFADVFLKSLFIFAGGEIAQLVITGGRLLNWSVFFYKSFSLHKYLDDWSNFFCSRQIKFGKFRGYISLRWLFLFKYVFTIWSILTVFFCAEQATT